MRLMGRIMSATAAAAVGALTLFTGTAQAAGPVTVPPNYVYDTSLEPKSLHDYCTLSKDQPQIVNYGEDPPGPVPPRVSAEGPVDFRGACARHDLCYAGSASKQSCDDAFLRHMYQQCEWTFGNGELRAPCDHEARVYHQAVVDFG